MAPAARASLRRGPGRLTVKVATVAGLLLVLVPLAFNAAFALLV
jgi:hypothetical protein